MEKVIIRDDFIKLGQAMKLAGMVGSGVDAKMLIQDGQVEVNGEVEYQRGKKLHEGDVITFNGERQMCWNPCMSAEPQSPTKAARIKK